MSDSGIEFIMDMQDAEKLADEQLPRHGAEMHGHEYKWLAKERAKTIIYECEIRKLSKEKAELKARIKWLEQVNECHVDEYFELTGIKRRPGTGAVEQVDSYQ